MSGAVLALFEGYGIEIEYMIVDAETLRVRPIADTVLAERAGAQANEWENGEITWCNELARHLLEFKTSGPAPSLKGLPEAFQDNVSELNAQLEKHGARLLPGGMHPWMDPHAELELWPYGQREIYETYDRIFSCQGHGWANLQSVQVNLPFSGDEEFARLHAAIRLVLPLLPSLAASTPFADGRFHGWLDYRMEVYRHNSDRVPSVTGQVIPETVRDMADYHRTILEPMYADIAPLDPEGHLQEEWLNSRGAIARFDRMAIEIRVIDSQECAAADIAVTEVASLLVRALVEESWSGLADQQAVEQAPLVGNLLAAIREVERAPVSGRAYLEQFGFLTDEVRADRLWGKLIEELSVRYGISTASGRILEHILRHGTLARRLLSAAGPVPDREMLRRQYTRLADCLAAGEMFGASA